MQKTIAKNISEYNKLQQKDAAEVCMLLHVHIDAQLKKSESKIWHGSPVWFLGDNPIVSYSVKKDRRVSLMFFSGQSFGERDLIPNGKFKAAERIYTDVSEVKISDLKKWLKKARETQWDYKNIIKNKGLLKKTKIFKVQVVQKDLSKDDHDQKFAKMIFATVYPMYLAKIERKGREKAELDRVIKWLTGFDGTTLSKLVRDKVTFEEFFKKATLHKNAHLITGVICGYRIEDIKNPLTRKVRYLDKLVDELAQGRKMDKILRVE